VSVPSNVVASKNAVLSVAAGKGVENLFKDLGSFVISGGQTMNPSTEDILLAIESIEAENIFVLPNNKNIIMAAEQAIPISTRKVIVIHTKTIPQGITAMLNFDPDMGDDENAIAMQNAFANISTGQVTFAARDSDYDGHKIKKGELLALLNGKVSFTEQNLSKCMQRLVKGMVNRDSAFLTLIYGEDVTEEQANAIYAELNEKFGDKLEITLVNGGQPVYYFILSVE
jgi:dihydroxyacetone kinase-like predicted kinase